MWRFVSTALLVIVLIPMGTIYRQNIEEWAAGQGMNRLLSEGSGVFVDSSLGPPLLALFFVLLGSTGALWLQHFFKSKFPPKFTIKKEVVSGKIFRHDKLIIDGKSFQNCQFNGVKLLYNGTGAYDFIDCSFGDFSIGSDTEAGRAAFQLYKLIEQSGRPIIFEDQKTQSPLKTEVGKPR